MRTRRQKVGLTITLVVFVGLAYAHVLIFGGLDASAALYIGLPCLLAGLVALAGKADAESVLSISMRALTWLLLASVPVLKEGFICVIMAAPILYAMVALVAYAIDRARRREQALHWSTAVIALMALEGVHPALSLDRNERIQVTRNFDDVSIECVADAVTRTPEFTNQRPWTTRIFPSPTAVSGSAQQVGDRYQVEFVYYKHVFWSPHRGASVYELEDLAPNYRRWRVVQDDSYLSNYLTWVGSSVRWDSGPGGGTQVTWSLDYRRKLDPAWYFAPLQRFYVRSTAEYLIDHFVANRCDG